MYQDNLHLYSLHYGTGATKRQKLDKIMESKNSIRLEIFLKGFPIEFCTFLHYCRQLRFDELPDYMYLRNWLLK